MCKYGHIVKNTQNIQAGGVLWTEKFTLMWLLRPFDTLLSHRVWWTLSWFFLASKKMRVLPEHYSPSSHHFVHGTMPIDFVYSHRLRDLLAKLLCEGKAKDKTLWRLWGCGEKAKDLREHRTHMWSWIMRKGRFVPAEPVKPVMKANLASRDAMYSLCQRNRKVRISFTHI